MEDLKKLLEQISGGNEHFTFGIEDNGVSMSYYKEAGDDVAHEKVTVHFHNVAEAIEAITNHFTNIKIASPVREVEVTAGFAADKKKSGKTK